VTVDFDAESLVKFEHVDRSYTDRHADRNTSRTHPGRSNNTVNQYLFFYIVTKFSGVRRIKTDRQCRMRTWSEKILDKYRAMDLKNGTRQVHDVKVKERKSIYIAPF